MSTQEIPDSIVADNGKTWRVRVVAHPSGITGRPPTSAVTAIGTYPARKVWAIMATSSDGFVERHIGYVLACDLGKTITASTGAMVDCWHAGISAGDLARNYCARRGMSVVNKHGHVWDMSSYGYKAPRGPQQAHTIHLSDGTSYNAQLVYRNEQDAGFTTRRAYRLWWLNEATDCMVGEVGECESDARMYFKRASDAVAFGKRTYGQTAERIS